MSTPFGYYLYHLPTGQHYCGIRHANMCHPDQLWTSYFTSSKVVRQRIESFGHDSFLPFVCCTFESSQEALAWEHAILTHINAAEDPMWINRHNGGTQFRGPLYHSDATKSRLSARLKGRIITEDHRQKISESSLRDRQLRKANGWKVSDEAVQQALQTRQERIQSGVINPYSKERNEKMAASKRGTKRHYLPDGSYIMVKP